MKTPLEDRRQCILSRKTLSRHPRKTGRIIVVSREKQLSLNRLKINKKRVYRLYCLEGLNLRRRTKKKRVSAPRIEVPSESRPNEAVEKPLPRQRY